ncbi:MAG: hypothetical protein ACRDLN_17855 [Solirubrobacteraceae bacterium]
MLHHRPRLAGLVAILAALVLAPSALAASASKSPDGARSKDRAYGKRCAQKGKGSARSSARAKCIDALANLASGRSASPRKACRGLSRKRLKGERRSAFARCVAEGKKLLKANKRADRKGGGQPSADDADDPSLDEGDFTGDFDSELPPDEGNPDEGDAVVELEDPSGDDPGV